MPPYRLQTLLEMRETAEEAAKQAFSEAMRALAKEKEALKALEAELAQRKLERKAKVSAYLAEVMKNGINSGGLAQMNRFEQRLKDEEAQVGLEIERQAEAVRQAEQAVELKRFEMAEAAKEKKAIEKHKDNWKAEVRKELQTKDELNQDEIGQTLHLAHEERAMSRVDDDRDAARVAARLAEAKRVAEAKGKERVAAASTFSKKIVAQKTASEQSSSQAAAAQQAQSSSTAHDAIAHLLSQSEGAQTDAQKSEGAHQGKAFTQARSGAKSFDEKVKRGASAEGAANARVKEGSDQGQAATTQGRAADDSSASARSSSRSQDSRASNSRLDDRKQSSDAAASNSSGASAAQAHEGERKTDADSGGGGQQKGGDKGSGEPQAAQSFRYNPALRAPVPVAQKNPAQGSDRLRRAATEIAAKIVERVRIGTNSAGKIEFQIDLKNDVLGGMTVKVSAKNGKISAVFSGSDKDVLKRLEEQTDALKAALDGRGLTLESLKIEARA